MRYILVFLLLLINYSWGWGQFREFNTSKQKIDQHLMIGLGSWAFTNLVGSGIGWSISHSNEMKHFHQMNVMWNTVNIGLAIPGYLKARKLNNSLSFNETLEGQRKTEAVFLFNAGLDLAYIGSGMVLRSEAKSNIEKADLYKGYGNSLVLQGGFLLLFDWIAYTVHRNHAKTNLSPVLKKLEFSDNGIGLKLNL